MDLLGEERLRLDLDSLVELAHHYSHDVVHVVLFIRFFFLFVFLYILLLIILEHFLVEQFLGVLHQFLALQQLRQLHLVAFVTHQSLFPVLQEILSRTRFLLGLLWQGRQGATRQFGAEEVLLLLLMLEHQLGESLGTRLDEHLVEDHLVLFLLHRLHLLLLPLGQVRQGIVTLHSGCHHGGRFLGLSGGYCVGLSAFILLFLRRFISLKMRNSVFLKEESVLLISIGWLFLLIVFIR